MELGAAVGGNQYALALGVNRTCAERCSDHRGRLETGKRFVELDADFRRAVELFDLKTNPPGQRL